MEAVVGRNNSIDVIINYIEKNRSKLDEARRLLEAMEKKVYTPALELADRAKSKITSIQNVLKAIDNKAFKPVLEITDKAKQKITDIRDGLKELDKKVLSPIIKLTGGDNSKLKFLQDGLKAIDMKFFTPVVQVMDKATAKVKGIREGLKAFDKAIFKPAVELIDRTTDTIKSIKSGLDFIGSSGAKAFDIAKNSLSTFSTILNAAKGQTIMATLAQWGFNSAMLANPVTWIVIGVIALIAAIILMVKHWDKVKAAVSGLVTWLKNVFTSIGTWLSNNWKKVVTTILLLLGPIGWGILALVRIIRTNWNSIKETVIAVWQAVSGFFIKLWDDIKLKAMGVWNAIGKTIGDIGNGIKMVWESVIAWLGEKFSWIQGIVDKLLNNPVFKVISGGVKGGIDIAGKFITNVSDWAFGKDSNSKTLPGQNRKETLQKKADMGSGTQNNNNIGTQSSVLKKSSALSTGSNKAIQSPGTVNITIPKIADSIVVREDADIDKISKAIAEKLKQHSVNMGVA